MGKKVTIQMVADLAGVSRGTVDRVLNNRSYVRADVRERVLDAIRDTGYVSPRESHQQQMDAALQSIKLGVLMPNWDNQFLTEVTQGIRQAQAELADSHVQVISRKCKTDLAQETIDLLEELRAEGVSGLAVCTLNDPSIEERVSALTEEGIPCITFNSDLPGSRRLCFVGQDIRKTGRVAAGLMSKCVEKEDVVLATVGNLKFDGHRQRLDGFRARMRELGFPENHIVIRETFNDYETTLHIVQNAIQQYPNLRGVYMANHNVSACAAAIKSTGKKGTVHVVCHDINESIRHLLLEGSVDFTIPQNFIQQGYAPLMLLRDIVRKRNPVALNSFTSQIDVLCAENLPEDGRFSK